MRHTSFSPHEVHLVNFAHCYDLLRSKLGSIFKESLLHVRVRNWLMHGWHSLQAVLVSATLPTEILEMTGRFMTDPVRIVVKRDELMLEVSYIGLVAFDGG